MIETNLNIFVLIGAALIDSINPCAIGVMIFLLTYLIKAQKKAKNILIHGLVYLFAVFATYYLAGLFLMPIIQSLRSFSVNGYIAIASIVAIFGILELKEYFAPGASSLVEISPRHSMFIKKISNKMLISPWFTFSLGILVALIELPCTGAVYLAIIAMMSFSGFSVENLLLLALYNLIFIGPLILILVLFCQGVDSKIMERFVDRFKSQVRLLTGILLLGLAGWMVAFVLL